MLKIMKSGIVVDEPMMTYGAFVYMTAAITKIVKINAQLITRYDKRIALAK